MAEEHRVFLLPPFLQELAELIGVAAAIAVARKWGGRRLYCPQTLSRDHELVKLIGRQRAELLCQRYTREHLDIPSARAYLRWYDARRYKAQGRSNSWIARELRINVTHVRTLLKGFTPDGVEEGAEPALEERCPACGRHAGHGRKHVHKETRQMDFGFPAQGS